MSFTPEESATPEEIAQAFSSHRFEVALPYLADDIVWSVVGDEPVLGRDTVEKLCRRSAEDLVQVTTEFQRFRTVVGGDSVVVDSLARYTEAGGDVSVVASCDIFDFVDGRVTEIVSYTIEIDG
ncbi:nuclear transport factor 2 family protein [Cryobacterium lactosi]|jgi:ketosteroid isomerase-like protein|uniref:Nuclear transport factor 2 family protein n=1 Tax=Cryobacterium lactosi TaxID=1259202 RepID=A0A4R9BMB4_9MICO|nr:nuclear transport factor 2 family protein [Cryobacterium lactosi]TFD87078.1 nuclear transport factor 2 family protein [Cryobacterium lactosi]